MKRAYTNGILLDGTEQMEPVQGKVLLTENDKITAIADASVSLDGYEVIDLHGGYLCPGLINLHVHLAGNGKPSAKPRDNAALVRKILSNRLTRAIAYRLVCSYAKLELLGGVTTVRTVGGIADFDTRCRDDSAAGKVLAPRILAANEGISVPGGHMAGSVAVAAHNNGEALTWEDLDGAKWAVQKTSSSAGYIYPSMWLMANYDGKKISDLSNVIPLDSGYGTAFSYAAAEQVDIIVCYADGRNDYEASWTLPTDKQDETGKQGMGRTESIWNELNVIGVTEGIYNDTVAISKASQYYTPEIVAALQDCFINIINTDEGKAIFDVYSHTGYAKATDADYDGARAALKAVSD